jgi:hypothetical protein
MCVNVWAACLTVDRSLTGQLLEHLCGTSKSVTRLAHGDVEDLRISILAAWTFSFQLFATTYELLDAQLCTQISTRNEFRRRSVCDTYRAWGLRTCPCLPTAYLLATGHAIRNNAHTIFAADVSGEGVLCWVEVVDVQRRALHKFWKIVREWTCQDCDGR